MCLPLVMRGELVGAIYLGNDKLTNLFTSASWEVRPASAAPPPSSSSWRGSSTNCAPTRRR